MQDRAIHDCYESVGILQTLILGTLDEAGIEEEQEEKLVIDNIDYLDSAAMHYADQLNPIYLQFADKVSGGIRKRQNSTGIYAHAMAVILDASEEDLIRGVSRDQIYDVAHAREQRIAKGNLGAILEKFEGLQVDDANRRLVLAYNEATEEISVVDRRLLLYRKYSTVDWPWKKLIEESTADEHFAGDGS